MKALGLVKYSAQGAQAVIDGGGVVARRERNAGIFKEIGLEIVDYWVSADPEYDIVFVVEGPEDPARDARLQLHQWAGGDVASATLIRLADPEDVDS